MGESVNDWRPLGPNNISSPKSFTVNLITNKKVPLRRTRTFVCVAHNGSEIVTAKRQYSPKPFGVKFKLKVLNLFYATFNIYL